MNEMDLPDLDQLVERARNHRTNQIRIRDEAQAEIDKADAYLERLTGKPQGRKTPLKGISDTTYATIIAALAGCERPVGFSTLSGRSHFSHSHVGVAMRKGEDRGHVACEQYGRKKKFRITEAGMEFASRPETPNLPGANPELAAVGA